MINPTKVTSSVEMGVSPGPLFTAREEDHVPYNKRRWEIENSSATVRVQDYDGKGAVNPDAWLEICLSETTQAKEGGPFQTRTISVYLRGEDRARLIKMLEGRA